MSVRKADGEIENPAFVGSPTLTVDRLVEEGETVVALGHGGTTHTSGTRQRFTFCGVFAFEEALICGVASYLVPLP